MSGMATALSTNTWPAAGMPQAEQRPSNAAMTQHGESCAWSSLGVTGTAVTALSAWPLVACCRPVRSITASRSSKVALMSPQTFMQSTPIATSARRERKPGERGRFTEGTAKALRMRRYAVSIGAAPSLVALGDFQFDKALFLRHKAPKNGRCFEYFTALSELNRAIETYSFAGRWYAYSMPSLSKLLRKKIRNRAEKALTASNVAELRQAGGGGG